MPAGYENLRVYYGDLHNHCEVGYGHGTVEEAYRNARLQLDFASVTAHAWWPDLPEGDRRIAAEVAYHLRGFREAARLWPELLEVTRAVHEEGRFVAFPSFEWHSLRYGDHNVYYQEPAGEIIRAADLAAMRLELRRLATGGQPAFLIPHHIGYQSGYRGLHWPDFSPEFSPVVEIFSMHGLSESEDGPYPYLHTMGPRDSRSTMQHGLQLGHLFGVIGSTDHHSAHPGSYGYGRIGAWAGELTREGIWEAIAVRRTYALTGDHISLAFSVNGRPMGSCLAPGPERLIDVSVTGGDTLDFIEVLHNNRPIYRWSALAGPEDTLAEPVKVGVEVGWGQQDEVVEWQVELEVTGGRLLSVEPRFRGRDVVAPQQEGQQAQVFSSWQRDQNRVAFTTQTWGNPTIVTPATQGLCLEIQGEEQTRLVGRVNGRPVTVSLAALSQGNRVEYLAGFLTPACCFHRAVPQAGYRCQFTTLHRAAGPSRDWYYVRVCQKNGQWAWSSPIWVGGSAA